MRENITFCGVRFKDRIVSSERLDPASAQSKFTGLNARLLGLIPAFQGVLLDNGRPLVDSIRIGLGQTRHLHNLRVPLDILEEALRGLDPNARPMVHVPEGWNRPRSMAELIPIMRESLTAPSPETTAPAQKSGVTADLLYIFPSDDGLFLRFDCFVPRNGTMELVRADFRLGITIIDSISQARLT